MATRYNMSEARRAVTSSNSRYLSLPVKDISINAAAALLCLPSSSIYWECISSLFLSSHLPVTYFSYLYHFLSIECPPFHYQSRYIFILPTLIFILSHPSLLCQSDSDQSWFRAHWFVGFGGVNCVILRILPWHGNWGRGWWEKRDKNREKQR